MPFSFSIYLATLRKELGFTQAELAALLSISDGGLSRIESRERPPTLHVLLGSEIVFLRQSRLIFPAVFTEVEDAVMAAAKALYEELEARTDLSSMEKLRHLEKMIQGAQTNITHL